MSKTFSRPTAALLLGLAIVAPLAVPAAAQDRPPVPPTRDYAITYRLDSGGRTTNLNMAYNAQLQRIRTEMSPSHIGIMDQRTRRMTMLLVDQKMAMEMNFSGQPNTDPQEMMRDAEFTRLGQDTVAGHRCTIYRVRSQGREGTSCMTAEGIMLRTEAPNAQGGGPVKMEAVQVSLSAQAASRFEVPPDFRRMQAPAGMPGGMPGAQPPGR